MKTLVVLQVLLCAAVVVLAGGEDSLARIEARLGKKLTLWPGTTSQDSSRSKRDATCYNNCLPAIKGNSLLDGFGGEIAEPSFWYSTVANGCNQLTITCGGYGFVLMTVNTPSENNTLVNFNANDCFIYSQVTATLNCEQYGWGANSPGSQIIDNAFTCQVTTLNPPMCG